MNWFHVLYIISASKIWSNGGRKGQYPLRSANSSYIENEMTFVLFQVLTKFGAWLMMHIPPQWSCNCKTWTTWPEWWLNQESMAVSMASSRSIALSRSWGKHLTCQKPAMVGSLASLWKVCRGTWQFFHGISSTVWMNWKHLWLGLNMAMRLVCHHTVLKCVTSLCSYPLIELSSSW